MQIRYIDDEPPVEPWADSWGPSGSLSAVPVDPGPPEVMVTRSCCYGCPGQDRPECCAHSIYLRVVTVTRELPSNPTKSKRERLTFADILKASSA